jgi:hypothetical protein
MALLQLIGPLGEIEVDQRLEARLNVDADSAFFRRPEQDADAARADSLLKSEKFLAFLVVVDDGDLFPGHSGRNEFFLHVLEEIEVAALVAVGKENDGPAFGFRAVQDIEGCAHGGVGFTVRIVRAGWIVKAGVKGDGAGVGVKFEPVVFGWVRAVWIAHRKAADDEVEGVVRQSCVFKGLDEDFGVRIEHRSERPAEGVLLDPKEFGLMEKLVGNAGEEVADSHARFEDAPAGKAETVCRRPHLVHDFNGRVVGVEGRFLDCINLVLGEYLGKAIALFIVAIALIPQFAQSAEVDVLRDAILFVGGRGALFGLDGLEQFEDVEVVLYARL